MMSMRALAGATLIAALALASPAGAAAKPKPAPESPGAMFSRAVMYESGQIGARPDDAKALYWYRKAAEAGHQASQWNVGKRFLFGDRAPSDAALARRYFEMAAAGGDPVILGIIGDSYLQAGDTQTGYRYLERAVKRGSTQAMVDLAQAYDKAQQPEKAFPLFLEAAKQGHITAQLRLPPMYEKGRGTTRNWKEAARWYQVRVEQGYVEVLGKLALMAELGDKDYMAAYKWHCVNLALNRDEAWFTIGETEREMRLLDQVLTPAQRADAKAQAHAWIKAQGLEASP